MAKKTLKKATAKKAGNAVLKKAKTRLVTRSFDAPPQNTTAHLPDYAQNLLSTAQGVPWDKAVPVSSFNGYFGLMKDSFHVFHDLAGMPNGVTNVAYYESKLSNDSDGSGDPPFDDSDRKDDTSLHLQSTHAALDCMKDRFAVLPEDADETDTPKHGLPDFGKDLGLGLGDIGVAFWRQGKTGKVNQCFYMYGDKGPAVKLGEGSTIMCADLKIDPTLVGSGLEKSEMDGFGKGVVHIAFIGSGRSFVTNTGDTVETSLTAADVIAQGQALFEGFKNQQ